MSNFLSNLLGAASGSGRGSQGNLLGGGKIANLLRSLSDAANPEDAFARLQMEQAKLKLQDEAVARTEKANAGAAAKNLLSGNMKYTPTDKGPIEWATDRAMTEPEQKNLLGYIPAAQDAMVSGQVQDLMAPQIADQEAKKLGFAGASDPKYVEYMAALRAKATGQDALTKSEIAKNNAAARTAGAFAPAPERSAPK